MYNSDFMRVLVIHFLCILKVGELPTAIEFKHIANADISVNDFICVQKFKACTR
jgi:hypothetical protein